MPTPERLGFHEFFAEHEPLMRRALVGRFGAELGREATAEAFAVTWQKWDRVHTMENRPGYVYRIGERWAARSRRRPASDAPSALTAVNDRYADPDVAVALGRLSDRQRQAVVLVHGFGMTHREVATLLGCRRSTVQNHVERGLRRLRDELQVNLDVG